MLDPIFINCGKSQNYSVMASVGKLPHISSDFAHLVSRWRLGLKDKTTNNICKSALSFGSLSLVEFRVSSTKIDVYFLFFEDSNSQNDMAKYYFLLLLVVIK